MEAAAAQRLAAVAGLTTRRIEAAAAGKVVEDVARRQGAGVPKVDAWREARVAVRAAPSSPRGRAPRWRPVAVNTETRFPAASFFELSRTLESSLRPVFLYQIDLIKEVCGAVGSALDAHVA